jgi:sulfate permease, SulP family
MIVVCEKRKLLSLYEKKVCNMKRFGLGRFEGYDLRALRKDVVSGIVVGIIAIPLGMAFAIASGVKPEYGIYTTIIAGIIISLFGGTRFQIGGPTGAFIPILFAIVTQYGYENLLIAGFLAGLILLIMGLLRLGVLMKYIPRPVTIGFTAGIAVIIFSGQLPDFLGLSVEKHEYFADNMREIWVHISQVSGYSLLVAAIAMAILLITPKLIPKVPGAIIALVVTTFIAAWLFPDKVATIGSKFGEIPSSLPALHWPELTWERIIMLLPPAFTIAMLGSIESLLSAVVADGMTGERHNSNRELIGQGIANMVTPLFGGIPATGAIARTATNIKNGAVSPLSGVFHGITVLAVLLLFAPYASMIPLASMAPVLMLVAWNMSERKEFKHVLKTKTSDSIILVTTFLLTVFLNLTYAVGVGLVLALVLFVKRMSELLHVAKVLPDLEVERAKLSPDVVHSSHDCPQISIFTVEGPLFFGAADHFEKSIMTTISYKPRVLLLRMTRVPFMDTTGESNLSSIVKHFIQGGGKLFISGIRPQPEEMLQRTGLYSKIGEENFFADTGDAINAALAYVNRSICADCKHHAFQECKALSQSSAVYGNRGHIRLDQPSLGSERLLVDSRG